MPWAYGTPVFQALTANVAIFLPQRIMSALNRSMEKRAEFVCIDAAADA
jgi:hypothetical protein